LLTLLLLDVLRADGIAPPEVHTSQAQKRKRKVGENDDDDIDEEVAKDEEKLKILLVRRLTSAKWNYLLTPIFKGRDNQNSDQVVEERTQQAAQQEG
jgi:hypothetical protein